MSIFQHGLFTLHSGDHSFWRIDLDELTNTEVGILAALISERVKPFHRVVAPSSHYGSVVPRLRNLLVSYQEDPRNKDVWRILVIDDVLTTGHSMEMAARKAREETPTDLKGLLQGRTVDVVGAVIFARGQCPDWITPVFQLSEPIK